MSIHEPESVRLSRAAALAAALFLILTAILPLGAMAAGRYNFVDDPRYDVNGNRWGSAANRIDEFLDQAFEYYLAGDTANAYDCVNNAYFCVYETTGFERQTMTYVSGPRKNAVELEFTTCKKAVKSTDLSPEGQSTVRSELNRLKAMIREDANKLAAKMEPAQPQTQTTYWQEGVQVEADPWAALAGESGSGFRSMAEAADMASELIDTAEQAYNGRDYAGAIDNINTAFFSVYEESGMSRKVYTLLSAEDRIELDRSFDALRAVPEEALETGKFKSNPWKTARNTLKKLLNAAAGRIDELEPPAAEAEQAAETAPSEAAEESRSPQWVTFLGAFGIIVREGLEAILVIAAIIAYLVKSGNARSLKHVYIGAVAGIAASFVAALILAWAKSAFTAAGLAQELIEGVTALIAMCVLFYVSNWMISKAEAAAWSGYIDSKVQSGVEKRSALTLAFTAFLSVFREGAEVVLFYQPMLSEGHAGMVWLGFGVGCVALVFVYLAITKLSIKLPIKVFFTATSILMAVMCVAFLGSGIKELAEGGLFEFTARVAGIPENDVVQILGIYPYLETLVPQLILSIILLVTFLMAHYRGRLATQKKDYEARLAEAAAKG